MYTRMKNAKKSEEKSEKIDIGAQNSEAAKYQRQTEEVMFDKDLADVNYHWAGSTNQRVIDVQRSLEEKKVILYKDNIGND